MKADYYLPDDVVGVQTLSNMWESEDEKRKDNQADARKR